MKKYFALIFGLILATSLFAQAGTGSITGVVTDSATGNPIFHAMVQAHQQHGMGAMAFTDSTGTYTIANLQAGNFELEAQAYNYHRAHYPTPVAVTAGQATTGIDFTLIPFNTPPPPPPPPPQYTGSISGVITDSATGAPIIGAMVTAGTNHMCGARAFTDSTGAYTILNLADGNYQVNASARNYRPAHYPTPVVVANGANTPDINMTLAPRGTPPPPPNPGSISGVVTDSVTGLPIFHAMVNVHLRHFERRAFTDSTGAYTIPNLRPGNYRVMSMAPTYMPKMYADPVIVVGGQATTDINFALVPRQP
jgi:protocatechuate 3,4-dioxygenase beta subunit